MPGARHPDLAEYPSYLKRRANPLEAFHGPPPAPALPGAFSAGSCESGLRVTVGVGFDFGPLLTFGAPVLTAQVGAEVEGYRFNHAVIALAHGPRQIEDKTIGTPLTLLQMTGFRGGGSLALTASLGIGVSAGQGAPVAALGGSSVTSNEVKVSVVTLAADNGLAVGADPSGSDHGTAASSPPDDEDDGPEEQCEAASAVVCAVGIRADLSVHVGVDYLLIRDESPTMYVGVDDESLRDYLGLVLNRVTKKEIKDRAIALLNETQAEDPEASDPLIRPLRALKLSNDQDKATRDLHVANLQSARRHSRWANQSGKVTDFFNRVFQRYGIRLPDPYTGSNETAAQKAVAKARSEAKGMSNSHAALQHIQNAARKAAESPEKPTPYRVYDYKSMNKQLNAAITYLESSPQCWVPGGFADMNWKNKQTFLTSTLKDRHRKALNDMDPDPDHVRLQRGDYSSPIRDAYLVDLRQKWDQYVQADLNEARQWEEVASTPLVQMTDSGPVTRVQTRDQQRSEAQKFLMDHRGAVAADRSRREIAKALTSRVKGEGGLATRKQLAEMNELLATLTRIEHLDRRLIKDRAVAYLCRHDKAPAWAPAAAGLLASIKHLAPTDSEGLSLIEDLESLSPAEPASVAPSHLTYVRALTPRVGADGSVSAKAILGGVGGEASAGARINSRWSFSRLQYPAGGTADQPFVATQDMRLARWEAALTAEATAHLSAAGRSRVSSTKYTGLNWTAARVLWQYPSTPPAAGGSQPTKALTGSGLNRGVTIRRSSLEKWIASKATGSKTSALVTRLTSALGVDEPTVLEFLGSVEASLAIPSVKQTIKGRRYLFVEASHALTAQGMSQLSLSVKTHQPCPLWKTEQTFQPDIDDTLDAMQALFQSAKGTCFHLQSISLRAEWVDELESGRSFVNLSQSYVLVLSVNVRQEARAATRMLRDAVFWTPSTSGGPAPQSGPPAKSGSSPPPAPRPRANPSLDAEARSSMVPPTMFVVL